MKVKLANIEVIEKLQMKKKEKDSIRISDLKCERCGSFFEMSYKIFTKKKTENLPFLCKKCRLSETYYKSNDKRQKTLKNKYGVTNNLHIKSVEQKIKDGWIEKYGVDNPAKSDEIIAKQKETIKKHTDEQKKLATEKTKKTRQFKYGTYFSKEKIEKTNKTLIEKYGSLENAYKQRYEKIQNVFQSKYGTKYPLMFYSHKKYGFDDNLFDSSWELAYYIWLKDKGISFEYHTQKIEYIGDDGKNHTYFPDFIVNGKIVEIKGDHFFNEKGEPFNKYTKRSWKAKYDLILQKGGQIFRFEDIKPYLSYVKENYGDGFLKQWKIK